MSLKQRKHSFAYENTASQRMPEPARPLRNNNKGSNNRVRWQDEASPPRRIENNNNNHNAVKAWLDSSPTSVFYHPSSSYSPLSPSSPPLFNQTNDGRISYSTNSGAHRATASAGVLKYQGCGGASKQSEISTSETSPVVQVGSLKNLPKGNKPTATGGEPGDSYDSAGGAKFLPLTHFLKNEEISRNSRDLTRRSIPATHDRNLESVLATAIAASITERQFNSAGEPSVGAHYTGRVAAASMGGLQSTQASQVVSSEDISDGHDQRTPAHKQTPTVEDEVLGTDKNAPMDGGDKSTADNVKIEKMAHAAGVPGTATGLATYISVKDGKVDDPTMLEDVEANNAEKERLNPEPTAISEKASNSSSGVTGTAPEMLSSKDNRMNSTQLAIDKPVAEERTVYPTEMNHKPKKEGKMDNSTQTAIVKAKNDKLLAKAAAWEEAKNSKLTNRYIRQESKILAREDHKKAKAALAMQKVEMHLQEKRARAMERLQNEVAMAHKEAEDRKATAERQRAEKIAKAAAAAETLRREGKGSRHFICF